MSPITKKYISNLNEEQSVWLKGPATSYLPASVRNICCSTALPIHHVWPMFTPPDRDEERAGSSCWRRAYNSQSSMHEASTQGHRVPRSMPLEASTSHMRSWENKQDMRARVACTTTPRGMNLTMKLMKCWCCNTSLTNTVDLCCLEFLHTVSPLRSQYTQWVRWTVVSRVLLIISRLKETQSDQIHFC
jgi:hypothetical protein